MNATTRTARPTSIPTPRIVSVLPGSRKIRQSVPESAVSGTVGWNGDEKSEFAVLMTDEHGKSVWRRSADLGYVGTMRIARIVADESVPSGVFGSSESYAIVVADPMSETHLVYPDGRYMTFRNEESAMIHYFAIVPSV